MSALSITHNYCNNFQIRIAVFVEKQGKRVGLLFAEVGTHRDVAKGDVRSKASGMWKSVVIARELFGGISMICRIDPWKVERWSFWKQKSGRK